MGGPAEELPGAHWLTQYRHSLSGSRIRTFLMKSPWKHSLVKLNLLRAKHVKYFMWIIQRAHCVYTRFSFDFRAEVGLAVPFAPHRTHSGPSVKEEVWEPILAHKESRPRASWGFYHLPHCLAPHKMALGVSRRARTKKLGSGFLLAEVSAISGHLSLPSLPQPHKQLQACPPFPTACFS